MKLKRLSVKRLCLLIGAGTAISLSAIVNADMKLYENAEEILSFYRRASHLIK